MSSSTSPTASVGDGGGATGQGTKRPSRALWFIVGAVSGVVVGLIVGVFATLVVQSVTGGSSARRARTLDRDDLAELGRLVARPLVESHAEAQVDGTAAALAALSSAISRADELSELEGEPGAIAREFADALRTGEALARESPDFEPLVRAGADTLQAGANEDEMAVIMGLLGIGSELIRHSEHADKASAAHTRLVACRLRLADAAKRVAVPETADDTVRAEFIESGFGSSVPDDTLFLTNVSGSDLSDVFVVVELTGVGGDQFHNCFFAEDWTVGTTLLAVSRTDRPSRETVSGVTRVRFRVFAAERTSRLGELAN